VVAAGRQVVAAAEAAAVASELTRPGASRILAITLGALAMAAGWIIAFLRDDDWSAVFAAVGTFAFVIAFAWPALSTWVRGIGGGRVGEGVVERLHVGTLRINGGRLCEFELLVHEPGRPEFRTRLRAFIDDAFVAQYGPGTVLRVGRPDADRDAVVLLDSV
jgi:hypothetical protein